MSLVVAEAPVHNASLTRVRTGMLLGSVLLVIALVFLFHLPYSQSKYLSDDSADYVRAARSPFLQTYLNTNSASPFEILRKLRTDAEFRLQPWDYLYFHVDNAALRHFHVPFSYYAMHLVSVLSSTDRSQRLLSSAVTATTCGAIVMGLYAFNVPLVFAVIVALVVGTQSRYTEVSISPSPHGWYILFAVLFLFSFASYLGNRRFRSLAVSAIFLAFAFATLEFSLELIASVPLALAVLWLTDRKALGSLRQIAASMAKAFPLFCLVTFVLWPGGWIRGGYLECYGVLAGAVLFKNKVFIGDRLTAHGLYQRFFAGHETLIIISLLVLLGFLLLAIRRKVSAVTVVLVSYTAVSFLFGVADHFQHDTYISESVLFLLVSAALLMRDIAASVSPQRRSFTVAAAIALFALVGIQEWSRRQPPRLYRAWLGSVLNEVSLKVPVGATILVNENWEAYTAYLPQYDYEPTVSATDIAPRHPARAKHARYFLLTNNAPPVPGTVLLQEFPTNVPGRTVNLYGERN